MSESIDMLVTRRVRVDLIGNVRDRTDRWFTLDAGPPPSTLAAGAMLVFRPCAEPGHPFRNGHVTVLGCMGAAIHTVEDPRIAVIGFAPGDFVYLVRDGAGA